MEIPHSPIGQTTRGDGPKVQEVRAPNAPQDFLSPALGNLGNAISNVGDFFYQRQVQTENFEWTTRFNEFKNNQELRMLEQGRAAAPGSRFSDDFMSEYDKQEQEFFKSMPERLQQEMKLKAQNLRAGLIKNATVHEFNLQDQYNRERLEVEIGYSLGNLQGANTIDALEVEKMRMDELLASAGLSEAEKSSLKRKYDRMMEQQIFYNAMITAERERNEDGPGSMARSGAKNTVLDLLSYEDVPEFRNMFTENEREKVVMDKLRVIEEGLADEVASWPTLRPEVKEAALVLAYMTGDIPEAVMDELEAGDEAGLAHELSKLDNDWELEEILTNSFEETLLSSGAFMNIPFESREAIKQDAASFVAKEWAAEQTQKEHERTEKLNALYVGLHDGTMGEQHIEEARESGLLSSITEIERAEKLLESKQTKTAGRVAALDKLQSGDYWADNKSNRDMLDSLIGDEGLDLLQQSDGAFVTQALLPVIRQTDLIPPAALDTLIAMSRGGKVEDRIFAYETLDQIRSMSPEAYEKQLTDRDARLVEYYSFRKNYFTPEELLAKMTMDPNEHTIHEQYRTRAGKIWTDPKSEHNGQTIINSVLESMKTGGVFGIGAQVPVLPATPAQRAGMEAQARVIFEEEYARYGEEGPAAEATKRSLARMWGVTSVGGVVMRYPPEQNGYPKLGEDWSWMEQQIRRDYNLGKDAQIQLISDDQTRNEALQWKVTGENIPSYRVVVFDPENGPRVMEERWYGDTTDFAGVEKIKFELDHAKKTYQDAQNVWRRYSANGRNTAPQELTDAMTALDAKIKIMEEEYNSALEATR